TNSISQGDTRSAGLMPICLTGGIIYSTQRRMRWPGVAAVVVSTVHIAKDQYSGIVKLDGKPVEKITAYLFDKGDSASISRLHKNSSLSFKGVEPYAHGFF